MNDIVGYWRPGCMFCSQRAMRVTLQYFDDCPNWRVAERCRFRGSPSILVDGVDPFAIADHPFGFSCRVYTTPHGPAGSPTIDQLREVLRRGE